MTACFLKLVFTQTGTAHKTINPKINSGFGNCLIFLFLIFLPKVFFLVMFSSTDKDDMICVFANVSAWR